ncbi:PTS lactose/cellobiose transporter subunit IIA [Enterococcus sp. BWB1-3]|uniref:PTS lactose/cellobiose transporter subunit IIA n=1 Tax=unclassified Enterococcus TaxID=2608891 RepID=UPI001921A20C|nr:MULTISPECIES: PTS lactose/cellobiose transporter subunit IIA [unclassified Enterococcus]MBL1227781.1 PTS lactose/cellobiose transporter subunit IIA [Enterococcus sp. BWB1-3]MCB5952030.1 PTS lactose/cellobiose transporter subunit IIA [Enterococcus sp. BWT-B8]MCB5954560.1 PTS lactose/cellobiose transporter subunit IIA [Enterococcus sp. CWB-B31]
MNKEEVAMIGFEVVAFAGEARSKLIEALGEAEKGNFDVADRLVEEANTSLVEAHKSQTQMLAAEARGESIEVGFIMVHAQDHLMTTMLLKDTIKHLFNIYKK